MAPRLTHQHTERATQLRREFNTELRDVPCQYCPAQRSRPVEIVPAEYKDGKLVRRPHYADLCWYCMRGLGITRPDRATIQAKVKGQKQKKADRREDLRSEMKANQLGLFDPDERSRNPLTGG